jgi:hypothetical protein
MPGSAEMSACLGHKYHSNVSRWKPTQANLVHDGDASILALLVELHHGRRNVARGDDMLLLANGRLDNSGVERVGDQANDQIVLGDLGVQGLRIGNIERDGSGILDAARKSFGGLQSPAGCGESVG